MARVRLTTTNNPWNPFTHFQEWYSFDVVHGYGCSEYLARVLKISDDLSENDVELMTEAAIDAIVGLAVPLADGALYKKVVETEETREPDPDSLTIE